MEKYSWTLKYLISLVIQNFKTGHQRYCCNPAWALHESNVAVIISEYSDSLASFASPSVHCMENYVSVAYIWSLLSIAFPKLVFEGPVDLFLLVSLAKELRSQNLTHIKGSKLRKSH